jgi:hypothetical protein
VHLRESDLYSEDLMLRECSAGAGVEERLMASFEVVTVAFDGDFDPENFIDKERLGRRDRRPYGMLPPKIFFLDIIRGDFHSKYRSR